MKTLKFIDIRRHLVSSLLELRVRPVGQPRSIVASCCVQTKMIFVQTSLKHTYSSKVTIGSVSSLSLSCTVGLLWHQGVGKLLAFMNFPTVELSLNACMFSNGGVKVTTCWFLQVKHISERWLETSTFTSGDHGLLARISPQHHITLHLPKNWIWILHLAILCFP